MQFKILASVIFCLILNTGARADDVACATQSKVCTINKIVYDSYDNGNPQEKFYISDEDGTRLSEISCTGNTESAAYAQVKKDSLALVKVKRCTAVLNHVDNPGFVKY